MTHSIPPVTKVEDVFLEHTLRADTRQTNLIRQAVKLNCNAGELLRTTAPYVQSTSPIPRQRLTRSQWRQSGRRLTTLLCKDSAACVDL
jgi:hypothetical protein